MAPTVREAIRELLEETMATIDALLAIPERELALPSSHGCAQGKDLWTLITNDIDHEKIHTGQVLEGRYESRVTASPQRGRGTGGSRATGGGAEPCARCSGPLIS